MIAEAHRAAADLLNADADEVVFGPNATTLLFAISRSVGRTLGPGDEVVVTRLDHDANVRPWVLAAEDAGATVRWVDIRDDDATLDPASFEAALSERTKARRVHARIERRRHDHPRRRARPPRARAHAGDSSRATGSTSPSTAGSTCGPSAPTSWRARPTSSSGRTSGSLFGRRELLSTLAPLQGPAGRGRAPRRVRDRDAEPRGVRRLDRRGRLPRGTRRERRSAPAAPPWRRRVRAGDRARTRRALPDASSTGSRGIDARPPLRASPTRTASTNARPRSRSASATSTRPRPRRRSPSAGSSSGTATTTRSRSWSGSGSRTRAARSGSGSATTTRPDEVDRVLEELSALA